MTEGTPVKILVVDDHPIFRDGLSVAMRRLAPACQVLQAGSIAEALAVAWRHHDLDLVLLDLVMPGCDGLGGLTQLRERLPAVPVVVVSMEAGEGHIAGALRRGASGFICKSADENTLVSALRRVLAGEVVTVRAEAAFPPRQAAPAVLTPRQRDILHLLVHGASNKEIAKRLGISPSTVRVHVSDVLHALGVSNRTQAAVAAERMGVSAEA